MLLDSVLVADWDKINKFVSDVGWHLVFGLNLLLRNGSSWDPSNAESLMKYSDQKGYQMHLELGNGKKSWMATVILHVGQEFLGSTYIYIL